MARAKIAIFSSPMSTIGNSPTLVTSNKARRQGERVLSGRYDHLVGQTLYEPVTVRVKKYSAHPLEEDAAAVYHQDGKDYYEIELHPEDGPYPLPYAGRRSDGSSFGVPFERRRPYNRDCPDQTDSSNHVTLWDGSNYKRAA